jgi:hypothetical protein
MMPLGREGSRGILSLPHAQGREWKDLLRATRRTKEKLSPKKGESHVSNNTSKNRHTLARRQGSIARVGTKKENTVKKKICAVEKNSHA